MKRLLGGARTTVIIGHPDSMSGMYLAQLRPVNLAA